MPIKSKYFKNRIDQQKRYSQRSKMLVTGCSRNIIKWSETKFWSYKLFFEHPVDYNPDFNILGRFKTPNQTCYSMLTTEADAMTLSVQQPTFLKFPSLSKLFWWFQSNMKSFWKHNWVQMISILSCLLSVNLFQFLVNVTF